MTGPNSSSALPEHRRDREVRMLRYWLRQAAGGHLTYAEQKQLDRWVRELDQDPPHVLTYSREDGFNYALRTKADEDALWRA